MRFFVIFLLEIINFLFLCDLKWSQKKSLTLKFKVYLVCYDKLAYSIHLFEKKTF